MRSWWSGILAFFGLLFFLILPILLIINRPTKLSGEWGWRSEDRLGYQLYTFHGNKYNLNGYPNLKSEGKFTFNLVKHSEVGEIHFWPKVGEDYSRPVEWQENRWRFIDGSPWYDRLDYEIITP
ncbi:MAG: hypothetical protein AAB833_00280 [Patescibacteria group bacterium]